LLPATLAQAVIIGGLSKQKLCRPHLNFAIIFTNLFASMRRIDENIKTPSTE